MDLSVPTLSGRIANNPKRKKIWKDNLKRCSKIPLTFNLKLSRVTGLYKIYSMDFPEILLNSKKYDRSRTI